MELNSNQQDGQKGVGTIDQAATSYGYPNPTYNTSPSTPQKFGVPPPQGMPPAYEQKTAPTVVYVQPQAGMYMPPPTEPINDYLAFSIIVLLCCCLPAGIVATIMSCGVRDAVAVGNYAST
jgi:hypothetical protein